VHSAMGSVALPYGNSVRPDALQATLTFVLLWAPLLLPAQP